MARFGRNKSESVVELNRKVRSDYIGINDRFGSEYAPVTLKKRPVMGNYATDVNSQVLMSLTTTDPAEVQGWLPGGDLHADLMALLHVYLGSRLDVRLQLCVDRSLLPDATMSSKPKTGAAQLGRTAVMRPLNPAATPQSQTITINLGRYARVRENIHRREADEDGDYHW